MNKYFKKILRNARGFTLLEIMIATGIFGFLLYSVMTVTKELMNTEKRSATQLSKSQFVNALGHYLYSPAGCNDLTGKQFNTSFTTFSLTSWPLFGGAPITTGTVLKGFTVSDLKAQIDLSPNLPQFTVNGESLNKTLLTIKAEVSVGTVKSPLIFNLAVLARNNGVVVRCGDDKTAVEICAIVKGVYNPATGLCNLNSTCNLKGTFMTLTCTPAGYSCFIAEGSARTNNYTGDFSCPAGSTATQTGIVTRTHSASCGSKCTQTVTDTARWYSCLECP